MIPAGIAQSGSTTAFFVWILVGFSTFFALEQLLHWRHCHRATSDSKRPLTYFILIGDGLHNFIGGAAVAGAFIADIRLGITAWLIAAALAWKYSRLDPRQSILFFCAGLGVSS